jgi:hypothetical protein
MFKILGWLTNNGAEVDTNNQLLVKHNNDPLKGGSITMFTEKDAGAITGARYLSSPEVSDDFRLRVGLDTILDYELFNYTNQRNNKHLYKITTLTAALAANGLTTNGLGVTTQNTGMAFYTCRYFPIYTAMPTFVEFNASLNIIPAANTVINFGLFTPGAANFYGPVDGVGFRWTAAGLIGFQNNNGTEGQNTAVMSFVPVLGTNYHYAISITQENIEFWINDVLYAELPVVAGNGQPMNQASLPVAFNHYITNNGAAGNVCQMKFTSYTVSLGDTNSSKPWAHIMAGMGLNGHLLPDNSGSGAYTTEVVTAYNADHATVIPSVSAATASGLGGTTDWALVITEATATRLLFSYQNPAPAVGTNGRNLYILGIRVCSVVRTLLVAPVAGLNAFQLEMGYGASGVNPNTADATTFANPTTKTYRKVPLGHQNFSPAAAVAGTNANDIDVKFQVPLVLHPGEFWGLFVREFNTAAGGLVQTCCYVDAYWE